MRFYILSDLHLGEEFGTTKACERLRKLCSEIRKSTLPKETVLFVVLGDIAHKGNPNSFDTAKECLTFIRSELNGYSVKFEFVPGNHDLENTDEKLLSFDNLIKSFGSRNSFTTKSAYSCVYEGVNFVFVDSTLSRNHQSPGQIDINAIKAELKADCTNAIFCHHALTHNYGDEHDTIENGSAVFEQLSELNVAFLFHGHAHRADVTIPTKGLIEIGSGSIAGDTSWMEGVFHQFCVGYIQAGTITTIQRWVDTNDGNGLFAENQMYPEPHRFADPKTINKEVYSPLSDYIERTVSTYELAIQDSLWQFLSKEKPISLYDALLLHKKILLLCDAGMGKSVELQNLAYNLSNDIYFPFLFSLRNYTGERIDDLLPARYRRLSPNYLVLLFDGYDELTNDLRELFERHLNQYIIKNCEARIVISSRSNFCKSETNNESRTFSGFRIFVLEELSPCEINRYLNSKGIDNTHFTEIASVKNVLDLLSNPFYLIRLCDIFLKENNLPPKTELMEKLIAASFSSDDCKFPGNLEDYHRALFLLLEKIAFAMQLMHQQKFDDWEEYQELIPLIEDRNLAKKSGLLTRDGTAWSFLHNNFREYLAARYLSKLPQKDAISVFSNGSNIKPSWVNTLSYFTGLCRDWDLTSWLIKHAPSALIKFEPDRLSPDIQTTVFLDVFCEYEDRQLYFDDALCSVLEFAHFAPNNETLSFLLDRISNPKNTPSQYTALNILRHFPGLWGRDDEVRTCLLNCCEKYPRTDKTVCRLAIYALYRLRLHSPKTTARLMELFKDSQEDYIRLGMYEYLVGTKEHDTHVEFFISGIQFTGHMFSSSDNPRVCNESFELVEGLKAMSKAESIEYILKWFSANDYSDFYESDEVLAATIDTAIVLFNAGNTRLYDVMLEGYLHAAEVFHHAFEASAVRFFIATDTHHKAVISAAIKFEHSPHYIGCFIDKAPTLIDNIANAYSDGRLSSHIAFRNIVKWYVKDEPSYAKYAQLLKEKDSVILPPYCAPIDHHALRKLANQEYFDALFDPIQREMLHNKLISAIGNPNTYTKQLLDIHTKIEHPSALWILQTEMYHHRKNVLVSDFFNQINIDDFILRSASNLISPKSSIVPTTSQKQFLSSLIHKKIEQGIFRKAVTYSSDTLSISPLVQESLSLIQHLDLVVDEDTLLQLTEFPHLIFHPQTEQGKYQFLASRLAPDKLKHRLLDNIDADRVQDMVLQDHIGYFESTNDSSLSKLALNICKTEKTYHPLRSTAWKYIYKTLGVEYFCQEVLPFANGEFLLEIHGVCKDIPPDQIRQFMEVQYTKEPSQYLQAQLITLDSEIALTDYVETVKRLKRPPENKNAIIDGPTAAIKTITNGARLPLLNELLTVVFSADFVDSSWHSLRSRLLEALINCGKASPAKTVQFLEAQRNMCSDKEENIRFCNYVIKEIERVQCHFQDNPLSLKETISFLKQN